MDIEVFQQQDNYLSQSSLNQLNNQLPKQTAVCSITEYELLAQRLEQSMKRLDLVNDAFASPENLEALRPTLESNCDRITLRVKILKEQKQNLK